VMVMKVAEVAGKMGVGVMPAPPHQIQEVVVVQVVEEEG